jgi:alpha-tubulin suppressor-like RCC1 family protein
VNTNIFFSRDDSSSLTFTLSHLVNTIAQVEALQNANIGQVAAGAEFSLALSLDRHFLYSFGRADNGQLGIGIIIKELECRSTPQIVQFPQPVKILKIAAGGFHVMVQTEEHELYTWGFDEEGATGHVDAKWDIFRPRKLDLMAHFQDDSVSHCHVVEMSGGTNHSLLLTKFFRKAT